MPSATCYPWHRWKASGPKMADSFHKSFDAAVVYVRRFEALEMKWISPGVFTIGNCTIAKV